MGFIYLVNIKNTDLYKIGTTKNAVKERIKNLQTGNPLTLIVIDEYKSEFYKKIELSIHRILKHKKYIVEDFNRLKGEWFKLEKNDVYNFKKICKQIEDFLLFDHNGKI